MPLEDFSQLKIQQEYKTKDLIAEGSKLTKEDIELPLENLLFKGFKRDVDVRAEEFAGAPDMWRITTEPEGNCCLAFKSTILHISVLFYFHFALCLHM